MSGQQNANYFSANQINLIYSTVIGQITSEEYVDLRIDLQSLTSTLWREMFCFNIWHQTHHPTTTTNLHSCINLTFIITTSIQVLIPFNVIGSSKRSLQGHFFGTRQLY
jgi:hypothetical protein